ncbi:MAG: hypothetical protein ACREHE_07060 [Rhizomicrobium sp.]
MSAVAKLREDKNAAPVWWHGPEGELGTGPVQWDKFWGLLLVVWLPGLAAIFYFFPFQWAMVLTGFCAIFVIVRFSRLDGTEELVLQAMKYWGVMFGGASLALYVGERVDNGSDSFLEVVNFLGGLGYVYATTIYFTSQRLIAWEPKRSKTVAPRDIPLADLKRMGEELTRAQTTLLSLPVFDSKTAALANAWAVGDPENIADILQRGNQTTQESWKRAITLHNRAATYVDHARSKLNQLLTQAEQRLAQLNLDYKSLEIERSKLGQVEFARAIPQQLTVKRINAQFNAIVQSPGRVLAQVLGGRYPPLAMLFAVPLAIIAHFVYKSRTLRRLKDAEGQLAVNAEAARGDFSTIQTILTTRTIPQFDSMMVLIVRLDGGLHDLVSDTNMPTTTQRDRALQLAFVMIEGKKLVATTAGD